MSDDKAQAKKPPPRDKGGGLSDRSANIIIGMGMFGAISVLRQYLQIVKGATPTTSRLLLIPLL